MRIAVVEPDPHHADLLQRLLIAGGHACQPFAHSAALLDALTAQSFDLVLTAEWAGDASAEELMRRTRRLLPGLPFIVVVASPLESEIVAALEAGADDCMPRPVRGPEMLARIDAILRRAGVRRPRNRPHYSFGDYLFDSACRKVSFRGHTVSLTPKEFRFALLLFTNASRPVSRAHILETVWHLSRGVSSRTLDTHSSRVRHKLQLAPEHGWRLTTLYGFGYELERLPEPDGTPEAPGAGGPADHGNDVKKL